MGDSRIQVGQPMPKTCPACGAIPREGYCRLPGCHNATISEPEHDARLAELAKALGLMIKDVRVALAPLIGSIRPPTMPDTTQAGMTERERIAAFLLLRDETLGPGEADDAERLASADEILALRSHAQPDWRPIESAPVEIYNERFDAASEAGQEVFDAGVWHGWLWAKYPDWPEDEAAARADFNRDVDGVAMHEAWDAHRDAFFARLPLAALGPLPAPPAPSPSKTGEA